MYCWGKNNLMCITDVFSIIKDIFLSGAAAITAYVAYNGLEKWQTELRGKANFEVARELIKSIYVLRDKISYCRSPFVMAHEYPEGYNMLVKHTNEEKGDASAYLYSNRWKPVGDAVQSFDGAVLEAEALWGASVKGKATILRQCARSLQVDMETFIDNEYRGGEIFKADQDLGKKVKEGIWEMKSEDNELTKRINAAIEELEKEIRPHLSRD